MAELLFLMVPLGQAAFLLIGAIIFSGFKPAPRRHSQQPRATKQPPDPS